MIIKPIIRELKATETGILGTMLHNAIFVPPEAEKLPFEIIELPEIAVYIEDFGRAGDLCLVAETGDVIAGAIWTRLFPENRQGFGFIDPETPELSMSVLEQYRRQGVGNMLMTEMMKLLAEKGYRQVSLSVDLINHAYGLYKNSGLPIMPGTRTP
jgi:ribosomal protein S18 acetylase RimI-like enzyme